MPSPPAHVSRDLCVSQPILHYLELHDLARVGAVCKSWHAKCHASRKAHLRMYGLNAAYRVRYWSWCAGVDLLFPADARLMEEYGRCLGSVKGLASLEPTGIEGEIARDVTRTFQRVEFFASAAGWVDLRALLRCVPSPLTRP
jgi:hypothetical protein